MMYNEFVYEIETEIINKSKINRYNIKTTRQS